MMTRREDRFYTTYGNFKGAGLHERKHARAPPCMRREPCMRRDPVAVGPVVEPVAPIEPVAPVEMIAPVETGMDVGMGTIVGMETDVEMEDMEETDELEQMGAVPGWVAASVFFEMTIKEQEEAMDGDGMDDTEPMELDDDHLELMDIVMDDHLERARKWAFGYSFWRLAIYSQVVVEKRSDFRPRQKLARNRELRHVRARSRQLPIIRHMDRPVRPYGKRRSVFRPRQNLARPVSSDTFELD